MSTQQTIVFTKGQETGLVIEKDGFKNSIFFDEYKHALATVEAIWTRQENVEDSRAAMDSNIVAFCGDRGEGKTSCMLTVQKILSDKNVRDIAVKDELMKGVDSDRKVETLDLIDPSFFDDQHNVIELVVGQLYRNFTKGVCEDQQSTNYSLRDELYHTFEETKSHMVFLNKKTESLYDNLEDLDVLAANMMLRDSISKLLKLYLEYMGKKNGRLILCLDDLDLNMEEGYTMVEQIRKYLNNKYCILFVAVNIEQLAKVIGSSFNKINNTFFPMESCMEMANKYITKLFPAQNRVIMPHVNEFSERKLQVIDENGTSVYEHDTVKEGVTKLIYQKTRYLFYNVKGETSFIVPSRLRELRHLLGMLLQMEDFKSNDSHSENKIYFKNYFFRSWINCLAPQDQVFATEITTTSEIAKINHLVVSHLRAHFMSALKNDPSRRAADGMTYDSLLGRICDTINTAYNISVGDVIYVVNQLNQNVVDESTHRLLFFIKSFYSMRLYDFYDYVTDRKEFYPSLSTDTDVYHESDWYHHVNKLQKFVNGAMFTYEAESLMPKDQGEQMARDIRELNTVGVYKLMRELQQTVKEIGKDIAYADPAFQQHFMCCEFIALTTTRNSKYSISQSVDLNRRTALPAHLDSFHTQSKGLIFDAMSIFTNLINVEYAYRRFDEVFPDFWSIAKGNSWSLLQLMMQSASKSPKPLSSASFTKGIHNLMSCSVIRNVDVHMALYERLLANRDRLRKEGSNHGLSKLKDFFDSIISTDTPMKTYNVDGANHKISFWCLQPIVDFLATEMADADGRLLSIYNSSDEIESITKSLLLKLAKDTLTDSYPVLSKTQVQNKDAIIRLILHNSSPDDPKQARIYLRRILTKGKYAKRAEFIAELAEHVDDLLTICPPKGNPQD